MTVVVSGGRRRPVGGKSYPLPSGWSTRSGPSSGLVHLLRNDGSSGTYEAMVRTQPWVYAVVMKLLWGASRLPLNAFEPVADGEAGRTRARGHPLDQLLLKPRPRTRAFAWKAPIWWDLLVHGKALVVKTRARGAGSVPVELWNVPWPRVQVISDDSGILGYNITTGSGLISVGVDEVIHYEMPGGISPLEPLRRTLAIEDAALEWQGQSLENGITPRGAFVTDSKLDERTLPRLRSELESLYAGPENAGRFGIFDQGMKWAQMGSSAVDAELIGQRKLSREEVCGAYDVAPPLVGILDRATFSNIDTLHTALYVDTLGSRLTMFEDTTQAQLVDPEPVWDGLFIEHNLKEILKPNPEAQARAQLMSQQSSTTTIDERRSYDNLPPLGIPGVTDVVLVPVNMVPAGTTVDPAAAPPPGKSLTDELVVAAFAAGSAGDSAPTMSDMDQETAT